MNIAAYIICLITSSKNNESSSISGIFLNGNSLGMIQMAMVSFSLKSLNSGVIFIVFLIIRPIVLSNYEWTKLLMNIFIDTSIFILLTYSSKLNRRVFKKIYEAKENLEKFKILSLNLPCSIVVLDKTLEKCFFENESFGQNFQVNPLECIKTTFVERSIGTIAAIDDTTLWAFLKQHVSQQPRRISTLRGAKRALSLAIRKDKDTCTVYRYEEEKKRIFEVRFFPCVWDDSSALVLIFTDMTIQQTNLSLQIADANKDKVISTISHELRTPINSLQMLNDKVISLNKDQTLTGFLNFCRINIKLLSGLLNSILDLQLVRSDKLKMNVGLINLPDFLSETLQLFQYQCEEKKIKLDLIQGLNIPTFIHTDKERLSEVFINLLSNAVKFTFSGSIKVGVDTNTDQENKPKILFYVQDTGVGIAKKNQKQIFNMFQKLETEHGVNSKGCGLGLTISNHIVNILNESKKGFELVIDSREGEGTKISFSIPLKIGEDEVMILPDEDISAALPYAVRKRQSNLRKSSNMEDIMNSVSLETKAFLSSSPTHKSGGEIDDDPYVILVDDNAFNLLVAENVVKKYGFKTLTCYHGLQAIETVRAINQGGGYIKLILMDCQMPIMDGFEATIQLKEMMKSGEIPHIPIIALSANNSDADKKKSIDSGMDSHISKPLSEKDLVSVLARHPRHMSL